MSDPIELPLDAEDRLADPPLVDSLHYERDPGGFSITFVPSAGEDPTHSVFIRTNSSEGKRVTALLHGIQQLVGDGVERVTHSGGGDYTLRLESGKVLSLSEESANESWASDVFNRLKQIADIARNRV